MISVSGSAQGFPQLLEATKGAVGKGKVYVAREQGGAFVPDLPDGKQVVLSAGSTRELTTTNSYGGVQLTSAGTYLNAEDLTGLDQTVTPTIRPYGAGDGWRKRLSGAGLLLLAPAIIGLISAGVAIYVVLATQDPTSAATVAGRAQTALAWTSEPIDQIGSSQGGETARREAQRRARMVTRCLRQLQGQQQQPPAAVPGVTCSTSSPPWYRDKEALAWYTLLVGALTAVINVLGTRKSFAFGAQP
jgi:hypothetical protein